jgi:hypothetical protein
VIRCYKLTKPRSQDIGVGKDEAPAGAATPPERGPQPAKEATVDDTSVSWSVDPRGHKPGEASPPSVGKIETYVRHAWLLNETLRVAMNGRIT